MREIIFIGVAGLVGTLGRYWLSGVLDQKFGPVFPVGTLVVNLLGCFLAGVIFYAVTERYVIDPIIRSALLIGFLGGFTTFSAFGIQTFTLLRDGQVFFAMLNVALSNVAGLLLVWAGYSLSRMFTI